MARMASVDAVAAIEGVLERKADASGAAGGVLVLSARHEQGWSDIALRGELESLRVCPSAV